MPMETYEKRLDRFTKNPPEEIILSMLSSIHSFLMPQLVIASEQKQNYLLVLGIHSAIETISKHIFLRPGRTGFKFYLKNFVDPVDAEEGFCFSKISSELNDLRNNIAHQWLSEQGHIMGYYDDQNQGYRYEGETLWINPTVYFRQFRSGFEEQGRTRYMVWDYLELLDPTALDNVKARFLKRFTEQKP